MDISGNCIPLVSIVSPMYNVEMYIRDFIKCILAQTYENWELILVDDGSSDNTLLEVEKFNDQRIKTYLRENRKKGANACRNIGMELANGKYVIILDSDDLVGKTCLEQRVHYMEQNIDVDYATARGTTIIENSDGTHSRTKKIWGEPSEKELLPRLLSTDYPFGVWNNIYRLDRIRDCLWDEDLQIYQDFDFMVTTILKGKRHAYLNKSKIDYYYREGRPNAITQCFISDVKHKSTLYLFDKIQTSIKKLDNKEYLHKKFAQFYILQLERLLSSGTENQYKELYKIFITEYPCKGNLRFRLLNLVLGGKIKDGKMSNSPKSVLVAHLLLFDQKQLFKLVHNKIKCEKNYKKH